MMEFFASYGGGGPDVAINPDQVCVATRQPDDGYITVHTLKWSELVYPLEGETLDEAWARLTRATQIAHEECGR